MPLGPLVPPLPFDGGRPLRVLVVDDDRTCRDLLARRLNNLGFEVLLAATAQEALSLLTGEAPPRLALVDWMMPGDDGLSLCAAIRARVAAPYVYTILVTARAEKADIAAGLASGADDYLAKPVDIGELVARIRAGQRILALESALDEKIRRLEAALARVRTLEGLISICMHCRRIRTGPSQWTALEQYIQAHSRASFSHGLCQQCHDQFYPDPEHPALIRDGEG